MSPQERAKRYADEDEALLLAPTYGVRSCGTPRHKLVATDFPRHAVLNS